MSELRGLVIGNSTWPSKLIGLRLGNIRESTNSQPQKETFENPVEKSKKKLAEEPANWVKKKKEEY